MALGIAVALLGCESSLGSPVRTDGSGIDAGTAVDAGTAMDAGTSDAATAPDAAGPPDSGMELPDAGPPDAGPPAFDLASATILNSPPDIASWPQTTTITRLVLGPRGVGIEFSKRDGDGRWPDVEDPTRWACDPVCGSIQYTLWIVLNVDGAWYASGCLEYWYGLDGPTFGQGGPPSQYAMNWYYDAIRWAPMTGHQPTVGEQVGFFVAAGDHRNNGLSTVMERSNVVLVPFPTDMGETYTF